MDTQGGVGQKGWLDFLFHKCLKKGKYGKPPGIRTILVEREGGEVNQFPDTPKLYTISIVCRPPQSSLSSSSTIDLNLVFIIGLMEIFP